MNKFVNAIIDWYHQVQNEKKQRDVDAHALAVQQQLEQCDRGIIRKQLRKILTLLPDWCNLSGQSLHLDTAENGFFVYKIPKTCIEKRLSAAVCKDIVDAINSALRQSTFEAFEDISAALEDASYRVQTALSVLSNRPDWNSPEIQTRYETICQDTLAKYTVAYRKNAPFLVQLYVVGIEDAEAHILLSIRIESTKDSVNFHPQQVRFI